ncbi:hypothetical protein [Streptomyces sp. NPDC049906]|uniref:hypothetical protein n=1 Tax=Streptomyces sp. NPDC049906 TaxID=3155656 RepID=UPI00342A2FCE
MRAWLRRLCGRRRPADRALPGGRRAAGPRHARRPTFVDDCGNPWSRPWTTPTPPHVHARYAPLRGEDIALVRPYVRAAMLTHADEDTLCLRALGRTA